MFSESETDLTMSSRPPFLQLFGRLIKCVSSVLVSDSKIDVTLLSNIHGIGNPWHDCIVMAEITLSSLLFIVGFGYQYNQVMLRPPLL